MKRLILDLEKYNGNAEVILSTYLDDRKVAGRMDVEDSGRCRCGETYRLFFRGDEGGT